MENNAQRHFKMLMGLAGALASAVVVARGLYSGNVPGFTRASQVIGDSYRQASQPSQFWFVIVFWAAACAGFAWLAWSAYRH